MINEFLKNRVFTRFKPLIRMMFILFLSSIAATLLLWISFCLPNTKIVSHEEASLETFNTEGAYPNVIDDTQITRLDNFTDALMINTASYSSLSLSLKL